MHRERTAGAHPADGVDQKRDRGDVIEMRVRQVDMIDQRELGEREVAHPGSRVEQDVVVDQKRGGAQMAPADSPAAPEYPQPHALCVSMAYFVLNAVTPSQLEPGGSRRSAAMRSTNSS